MKIKLMTKIDQAKQLLENNGYVVLKAKSYRQAQERQRVAEALKVAADEYYKHTRQWAESDLIPEIRRLTDRCTFLYGKAIEHGAKATEL